MDRHGWHLPHVMYVFQYSNIYAKIQCELIPKNFYLSNMLSKAIPIEFLRSNQQQQTNLWKSSSSYITLSISFHIFMYVCMQCGACMPQWLTPKCLPNRKMRDDDIFLSHSDEISLRWRLRINNTTNSRLYLSRRSPTTIFSSYMTTKHIPFFDYEFYVNDFYVTISNHFQQSKEAMKRRESGRDCYGEIDMCRLSSGVNEESDLPMSLFYSNEC